MRRSTITSAARRVFFIVCIVKASGRITRIAFEPGRDAIDLIAHEAWPREVMVLAGVNHEFGRHAERAHGLVHLFGAGEGYVEVLCLTNEQGRRVNAVGMKKWIRKFDPQVGVFPRRPEFPGAGEKILVRAIHRNRIAFAGDAHGRLETAVTGDRIVGQDAAIASSADPELAGVGDSLRHDVIDTGQQVLDFQMTPVGEYRLRVIKSAAAAASIIDAEDDIAFGGEHLPLELPLIETEIVLVLPARAAVYPQK